MSFSRSDAVVCASCHDVLAHYFTCCPVADPHVAGLSYLMGTKQNAGTDMLTLSCCALSVSQHNYAFVKMIKEDHKNRKEKATAPAIKTYHFLTRKYGRELLLDIGRIESLKNFIVDDTPHNISFYEILFIEKGKGSFALDENKMTIGPGTIIFTSRDRYAGGRSGNLQVVTPFSLTKIFSIYFSRMICSFIVFNFSTNIPVQRT